VPDEWPDSWLRRAPRFVQDQGHCNQAVDRLAASHAAAQNWKHGWPGRQGCPELRADFILRNLLSASWERPMVRRSRNFHHSEFAFVSCNEDRKSLILLKNKFGLL
jgi:hypothetical protein